MTLEFPLKSGVDLNARIEPGGSKHTISSLRQERTRFEADSSTLPVSRLRTSPS